MIKRKIKFKLKEKCWCEFFYKLSQISTKYECDVYICYNKYNIRENAKDLMALISIPVTIFLKEKKFSIENILNFEEVEKVTSCENINRIYPELEFIIEVNGKDEIKALEEIISYNLKSITDNSS
ncbi:MAG: hypothetical protein N2Z20_00135 [Elusimicrobiales bacterium]|nr:hypothetical protein [Elusimicrobiales bacterium]